MSHGYETTRSNDPGSKRGDANPAYSNDAAHVLTQSILGQLVSLGRVFDGDFVYLALPDSSMVELFMRTGNVAPIVDVSLSTAGNHEFFFFEDTTVSADGAAQSSSHFNRTKLTATLLTGVFINPTVTGDGTELDNKLLIGGEKNSATSAGGSSARILAADTNYLWRFINQSGSAQNGTIAWAIGE